MVKYIKKSENVKKFIQRLKQWKCWKICNLLKLSKKCWRSQIIAKNDGIFKNGQVVGKFQKC